MVLPAKASSDVSSEAMESVLLGGDLSKLTPPQRVHYYQKVCESLGLNPLTRPLEYITLNGKLTLYAKRDCAEQLRRRYHVSLEVVSEEIADDVITIHVRARLPDGRTDEDFGVVPFPATLKGEAKANQKLKAITKAKRRVTLSICGLGFLDETEVSSINSEVVVGDEAISAEQAKTIGDLISDASDAADEPLKVLPRFLKWAKVESIKDIPASHYDSCIDAIKKASRAKQSVES